MQNTIYSEYLTLVRDLRTLIQSQVPHSPCEPPAAPIIKQDKQNNLINYPAYPAARDPAHPVFSSEQKPLTAPIPVLPPVEKQESLVATISSTSKPVVSGAWELQPMASAENVSAFHKKLSPFVQTCDPLITTFLVLPEENKTHRFFLENVCRAITRSFSAASVILYTKTLFSNCKGTLFLIPVELLKKDFPQAQSHVLLKREDFTALPLEPLDLYAQDVHSKRALWNAIQHMFQS